MKQQELLRKQADIMDMAEKYGIKNWKQLVRVKFYEDICPWREYSSSSNTLSWWNFHKFALGVVEGKPVFEGDTLYAGELQHVIVSKHPERDSLQCIDPKKGLCDLPIRYWSWNPPKPKTVMVELSLEEVEWYAKYENNMDEYGCVSKRAIGFMDACRKALEGMK